MYWVIHRWNVTYKSPVEHVLWTNYLLKECPLSVASFQIFYQMGKEPITMQSLEKHFLDPTQTPTWHINLIENLVYSPNLSQKVSCLACDIMNVFVVVGKEGHFTIFKLIWGLKIIGIFRIAVPYGWMKVSFERDISPFDYACFISICIAFEISKKKGLVNQTMSIRTKQLKRHLCPHSRMEKQSNLWRFRPCFVQGCLEQ